MEWSSQQDQALTEVAEWLKSSRQVFYLAGYAGTGKTTLAQHFASHVDGVVLFAAYTGKAASVLQKKGAPDARTLHSILYEVSDADKARLRELQRRLKELLGQRTDGGTTLQLESDIAELEDEIIAERKLKKGPMFHLNPESILRDADLLVLDECSMVDQRLAEDALSFGVKILVLGDPAQLPPVKGKGYFTNQTPDMLLTEIHRQAADNQIIRAATALRERRPIPYGEWDDISHIRKGDIDQAVWFPERLNEGYQALCGKNKTRRKLNQHMRRVRGHDSPYPEEGEPLVVLKNDKNLGVLNGVVCTAASTWEEDPDDEECVILRLDYDGTLIPGTPTYTVPFDIYRDPSLEELYSPGDRRGVLHADYGYALTVHKAQGSEWDRIVLIDDGFGKWRGGETQRWQWLYTAATRASEKLLIVS